MGSGIAEAAASAGIDVVLYEPEQGPLDRSRERLEESLGNAVARGKLEVEAAETLASRISYSTTLAGLDGADVAIEAVLEDPQLKGELFQLLDEQLPDATFLASNTSSIPIGELAARTKRPERVVGLHFFSPVQVMKLVEIVAALDTSTETLAAAESFATRISKKSIRTKDRAGFVVNMLLVPYLTAAVRMCEEGFASRDDIDVGMQLGCGHPMGPLSLCDFIGLDVLHAVCESLYDEFRRPEYAAPPLMRRMVASGHLGRKTGRGFFHYAEGTEIVGVSA
jgi:3-hydroxybutyryl-CoA dehydrogenase